MHIITSHLVSFHIVTINHSSYKFQAVGPKFFIEFGAYDGESASNSLGLEMFDGWEGIIAESDQDSWVKVWLFMQVLSQL